MPNGKDIWSIVDSNLKITIGIFSCFSICCRDLWAQQILHFQNHFAQATSFPFKHFPVDAGQCSLNLFPSIVHWALGAGQLPKIAIGNKKSAIFNCRLPKVNSQQFLLHQTPVEHYHCQARKKTFFLQIPNPGLDPSNCNCWRWKIPFEIQMSCQCPAPAPPAFHNHFFGNNSICCNLHPVRK